MQLSDKNSFYFPSFFSARKIASFKLHFTEDLKHSFAFDIGLRRKQIIPEDQSNTLFLVSINMDVLANYSIFQELQLVHDTGYFSAMPSLEENWQQVRELARNYLDC